jgi:hypothetical protein
MPILWLIPTFVAALLVCALPLARRVAGAIARWSTRAGTARCAGFVFVSSMLIGSIPNLLNVVPPPSVHDEFAYLLAADTFAHGRLTNPTPPLWEHFETFHEIMVPTYMAKFPPGQGLALAAGKKLGLPILGAFGTIALACAAVTWMLRAWMPPRWALAGGMIAALHPTIYWWGQCYWGGGVAMLGGALAGGAFARAMRRAPKSSHGLIAGLGMAILANSRPFEGAIFSTMLLAALLATAVHRRRAGAAIVRVLLPGGAVLAPVFGWMLYYNYRVTGDALTMPYVVHARQYMMAPLFWWESPRKPVYRHPKLQQYYELHEFKDYNDQRTPRGFFAGVCGKTRDIATAFFAPPTLAVALLGLPAALRRRRAARLAAAICILLPAAQMLMTPWMRMQYLAPAAGMFCATIALSLRALWGKGWLGAAIVRAILVMQLVATIALIVATARNPNPTGAARARVLDYVRSVPGNHLIIVRYGPGGQSLFEWVFNDSDIERSRVVMARELAGADAEAGDARLLDHFRDRHAWLLSVDGTTYHLDRIR